MWDGAIFLINWCFCRGLVRMRTGLLFFSQVVDDFPSCQDESNKEDELQQDPAGFYPFVFLFHERVLLNLKRRI